VAGYADVPYSSLEQSKEGDYLALRRTQGTIRTETPDWTSWLSFFLEVLQRQTRWLREQVERERLLLAKLTDLAIQILGYVRDHGCVTIADAVIVTGASRHPLKGRFKTLCERGLAGAARAGQGGLVQPAEARTDRRKPQTWVGTHYAAMLSIITGPAMSAQPRRHGRRVTGMSSCPTRPSPSRASRRRPSRRSRAGAGSLR